ncbi:MAG: hypothetical protein ACM3S5_08555 [Rhodospirillales bacterium]
MLSELLILSFALVLFFYWFRYNCHAILRTARTGERARQVAAANELRFPYVLEYLQGELTPEEIEALDTWLQRDYEVLTSLLRYTSVLRVGSHTVEQRILMADFKLQQLWFAMTKKSMTGAARRSLEERSHILAHFANTLGARSASLSRI